MHSTPSQPCSTSSESNPQLIDGDRSNIKNSRKELRILNALATISIRDYGAVAVVAAYDEPGSIQVLVTYLNHNEGQLIIAQPPNTILDYLTNFRFARNPDLLVNSEKEKVLTVRDRKCPEAKSIIKLGTLSPQLSNYIHT